MTRRPVIALPPGEPAGIGPDIAIAFAQQAPDCALVLIADPALLTERAALLDVAFKPRTWNGRGNDSPAVYVLPIATSHPVKAGKLDPANSPYVIECQRGLRVARATPHLPLAEASRAIPRAHLGGALRILHADLRAKFGIPDPQILVCGLNPHAGEGGHLGREEIEVIETVRTALRAEGFNLRGPVPADTAFIPVNLAGVDAVLAMYHDQGLPVLKAHDFAHAINITLEVPFARTSVDHGTALELAGSGRADPSSLRAALEAALSMIKPQMNTEEHR